jgi:Flp pilus assembly protein TadB
LTKTKKRLTVPPFGHFLARIYDTTVESRTYQNDSAPRDSEKGKEKKKRQRRASRLDADQLKENCSQQRRRRRQWLARPGRVNERSNRSRSLLGFSFFFFLLFCWVFFLPWVFSHI